MIMTGMGTKFQIENTTTPGTFDDVGSVASITPPQLSRDTVEVSSLDPGDGYKQYLVGLKDGGEVTVTVNFDTADAGQTALYSAYEDGESHNFKIVFPDASNWAFAGYITGYAPADVAPADVMQVEVTIRTSGKPVFATV